MTPTTLILICFVATFTLIVAAMFLSYLLPTCCAGLYRRWIEWGRTWSRSQLVFTAVLVLVMSGLAVWAAVRL